MGIAPVARNTDRLLWRMVSAPASYVVRKFPILQTVGDTLLSYSENRQQHSTEIDTQTAAPQGIKETIISIARNYNPYQQSESDKAHIEELQARLTDLEAELANKSELGTRIEELQVRLRDLEAELANKSELETRIETLEAELAEAHRKRRLKSWK